MNKDKTWICNNDECDGFGIEKIPGTVFHQHTRVEDIKVPKEEIVKDCVYRNIWHSKSTCHPPEPEQEPKEEDNSRPEFKECFECAKKPGSPELCAQCLWVRDNYKLEPKQEPKRTIIHVNCDATGDCPYPLAHEPKQAEAWREKMKRERPAWYDELMLNSQRSGWLYKLIAAVREESKKEGREMLLKELAIKNGWGYRDSDEKIRLQALNDAQEAIKNVEGEHFFRGGKKPDSYIYQSSAIQAIENLKNLQKEEK